MRYNGQVHFVKLTGGLVGVYAETKGFKGLPVFVELKMLNEIIWYYNKMNFLVIMHDEYPHNETRTDADDGACGVSGK